MVGKSIPLSQRFWSRVIKAEGCWQWVGTITHNGYGRMHYSGHNKSKAAHHVSLELHGITIPAGLVVDHICRNRACVNPEHLRVVTQRENVLENSDSPTAVNYRKTHCSKGHSYLETGFIDADNKRQCRVCRKAYISAWHRRQRANAARD